MKIGIDARLLNYRRGIGTFVYHLITELSISSKLNQYLLYVDDRSSISSIPADDRFTYRILRPVLYPIWEQFSLPRAALHDQIDVLHCPANTAPLNLSSKVKLVLTIHDVMYMMPTSMLPLSPSFYQRLGRLYRRVVTPRVVQHAAIITTVSEQSRRDIFSYLGPQSVRIDVTREAASPKFCPLTDSKLLDKVRKQYQLQDKIILALGGIDPRKNTLRIIEAFAAFLHAGMSGYKLVIVGLPKTAHSNFRLAASNLGIDSNVIITNFVPEEDLVALYNLAETFLYPSLYEGFGLPVLEAMACGTPVITSAVGSIPEVAGNAALMINPTSVESIAQGIKDVVTNAEMKILLREKGLAQAKRFSWQQMTQQMLSIYERVIV